MSKLKEQRDYYPDRTLKSVYFIDKQGRKQGEAVIYEQNSNNVLYKEIYKDGAIQQREDEHKHLLQIFGEYTPHDLYVLKNQLFQKYWEKYNEFSLEVYDSKGALQEIQSAEKVQGLEKPRSGSYVAEFCNGMFLLHRQQFDAGKITFDGYYDRLTTETPIEYMHYKDEKEWNGSRAYKSSDGKIIESPYRVSDGYYIGEVNCSLGELWKKGYSNLADKTIQTEDESIELSDTWHIKGEFRQTADGIKFSGALGDDVPYYGYFDIHAKGTYIQFDNEGSIRIIPQSTEEIGYEHSFVQSNYSKGILTRKAEVDGVYHAPDGFGWVSDRSAKIETLTRHEDSHIEHLVEEGTDAYHTCLDCGVPFGCARRKIERYTTLNGRRDGVYEEFDNPRSGFSDCDNKQDYLRVRAHYKEGVLDGLFQQFNEKGWVEIEAQYKDGKLHGEYKLLNSDGTVASVKIYENGVYKEKSKDGKTETWYDEKNNVLFHATDGKDDTKAYLKAKERREVLREIVAKKIDKRDAKNPNAKKERVITHKTLTKLKVAWKARQLKDK